ncbi:hypothetical protein PIB30_100903 [Stylosanthes scabra]|uniref:Uncharacterized protein n=1 Tax=Stylosanthes scabra TaxID=79078 RepID=A0ABU6SZP0_9FABA|nr:hypothetical protein [Stylosanthes scabra]
MEEATSTTDNWILYFKVTNVSPYGHIEIMHDKDGSKFTVNGQRLKHYLGGIIDKEKIVHDLT